MTKYKKKLKLVPILAEGVFLNLLNSSLDCFGKFFPSSGKAFYDLEIQNPIYPPKTEKRILK